MGQVLFMGNEMIWLDEVESTNAFAQQMMKENPKVIEGLVVAAKNQTSGKGQRGNKWYSEGNKNLTFSVVLKPNISIGEQFMLSKVVALAMVDCLRHLKIEDVTIKWPNDIYVKDKKIAGILIENSLKRNKISDSIIGVGLNVNQTKFSDDLINPTSMVLVRGEKFTVQNVLDDVLFFLEQRYMQLKKLRVKQLNHDYISNLYGINEIKMFLINEEQVLGKICGVAQSGKLQVEIDELIKEFDLKEIKLVIG